MFAELLGFAHCREVAQRILSPARMRFGQGARQEDGDTFPKYDALNGQFLSGTYNMFQKQERYDSFGNQASYGSFYKPVELTTTFGSTIGRVDRWDRIESTGGYSTGLRLSNDGIYNTFGTGWGRSTASTRFVMRWAATPDCGQGSRLVGTVPVEGRMPGGRSRILPSRAKGWFLLRMVERSGIDPFSASRVERNIL